MKKFLKRMITPLVVATTIVATLVVDTGVAGASWVQQRWDLTTWGSVQTVRDSAYPNHWGWYWYAPGDGVPNFLVNEVWLGAPCNGPVTFQTGSGNGYGSGTGFVVLLHQLPGSQYTCIAPQDGRWSGGAPFAESSNTCGSYYSEGHMGSYAPTSVVTSNGIFCNDGVPAFISIVIGGYNA